MIVSVPGVMPVTVPAAFMVAIVGVLLLHVPPLVASLSTTVVPAHRFIVPVMPAGDALTTIARVTVQPVPNE